jgi:hypothetical protein
MTYHAEVAAEVLVSGEGREEGSAGGRTTTKVSRARFFQGHKQI